MAIETQKQDDRCRIHLEVFEGPLDLLLYLIKRDEIDIYDIPINHVVNEYVAFIDEMKELNLNIAGEYLLMATLLLSIKARMLLPKPEIDTDEIEDPRQELIDMLVEYKLFKRISEDLMRRREEQERLFPKGFNPEPLNAAQHAKQESLLSYDFYTLVKTAWQLLKEQDRIIPGFEGEDVNVSERMDHILEYLREKERAQFIELMPEKTTPMMFVATFIGLLELIRAKRVRVYQRSAFGNIWIYPIAEKT